MRSTIDHVNEGRDQTADTLNHATEQVADMIREAARLCCKNEWESEKRV
jgi:hypothetical protein